MAAPAVLGVAAGANATTPLAAFQQSGLGFSFAGSGFLILFYTGVVAVLQQLGVINNSTKLVGASSGSLTSGATCAGMSAAQQFASNFAIARECRSKQACAGFLASAVRKSLSVLPADAAQRCNGRLGVVVTEARVNASDVARVLSGGQLGTNAKLVDALVASSYIPTVSGSQPVVFDATSRAFYDGGFSMQLPTCLPGVKFCVHVSHLQNSTSTPLVPPPNATAVWDANNAAFLARMTAAGLAAKTTSAAARAYLPLDPVQGAPPVTANIYPGLSGPVPIPPEQWNVMGLSIGNDTTLMMLYDQGRKDAAAWAVKHKLATEAQAKAAVAATAMKLPK